MESAAAGRVLTTAAEADFQSLLKELAPVIEREPRPRAAIRVGAIGHRKIGPESAARISATVSTILSTIASAAKRALEEPEIQVQFAPGLDLVLISPLAEGADWIIADRALAAGFGLGAVLPFDRQTYETTFDLGDRDEAVRSFRNLLSRAERPAGYGVLALDGDATLGAARDAAFQYCGTVVTNWSDIVIAVLSGERETSQTGTSVQEALALGLPVITIDPASPDAYSLRLAGVGPIGEGSNDKNAAPADLLRHAVKSILAPTTMRDAAGHGSKRYGITRYRDERFRSDTKASCDFEFQGPYRARTEADFFLRQAIGLYPAIERAFRGRRSKAKQENASPLLWDLPLDRASIRPLVELHLRYQRADTTASAYAGLQRSVQLVIALLGVLTVVFSAVGPVTGPYETLFAFLELVTLTAALRLVYVSYSQDWLDRWLDCRLAAEILRYARFLLLTGRPSPLPSLAESRASMPDERAWARDYARHVLRIHGFTVPGRGLDAVPDALPNLARYVSARAIDDQVRYHREIGRVRMHLGDVLKTVSYAISILAFVVVAGKLVLELCETFGLSILPGSVDEFADTALEISAVILPALAAGVLAWRAFGEFEIIGRRSEQMVEILGRGRAPLLAAPNLRVLGDKVFATVLHLLQHVDGWRELYSGKHLES